MPCIRQDYINGYECYDRNYKIPKHIHNNYTLPRKDASVAFAFRKAWENVFDGDCFFFDYHLYSDHLVDPGYCQISHRLMRDMKLLSSFNSQGIMHCSSQRRNMPNSYPTYMCGEVLVNPQLSEETAIEEYFCGAYGEDRKKAYNYLATLSELFQPDLLREGDVAADEEMYIQRHTRIVLPYMFNDEALQKFQKISDVIKDFTPVIEKNLNNINDPCRRLSWDILRMHAPIALRFAQGLCEGAFGNMEKAQEIALKLIDYLASNEDEYLPHLDFGLLVRRIKVTFGFTNNIFESIK